MKFAKSLLLLLIFACCRFLVNAQAEVNSLLPAEFKALAAKTKGIIIDVRNKEEYDFAHIENAIQVGVESEDFIYRIRELDKNKAYFVYCSMDKRSDTAIHIMQSEGFKNVYGLKGGFLAWKKEQLPVVKHAHNQ